jgi:CTP:molybdopterin cytidylyltransferase MocA
MFNFGVEFTESNGIDVVFVADQPAVSVIDAAQTINRVYGHLALTSPSGERLYRVTQPAGDPVEVRIVR